MAAPFRPALQLTGPGEKPENQQEDDDNDDDLGLENDEDHTKLRVAGARPGAEDGSPSTARGGDGTINPPFP